MALAQTPVDWPLVYFLALPPLLFLLDEILHGTNSHDRRIGAEGVVRRLVEGGAIGLVSTHDLALAEIVQTSPSGVRVPIATEAGLPVVTPTVPATAVDPVCQMSVPIAAARQQAEVDGVTYYFCCAGCRTKFLNDPQAYLAHP